MIKQTFFDMFKFRTILKNKNLFIVQFFDRDIIVWNHLFFITIHTCKVSLNSLKYKKLKYIYIR